MKSKLKRLFARSRWYILMLVLGLAIFIVTPMVAPVNYQNYEDSGSPTSVIPQKIVSAHANSSGKIAIIDNTVAPFVIALTDTKNSKAEYIVNNKQLEFFDSGNFTTYAVALDDDDNMYIHCIYWIDNEGTIKKEEIVKISHDGKYDGRIFSAEYYSDDNSRSQTVKLPQISQLSCTDGKLGFAYCDNSKACIYEVDCKTGAINEGQNFLEGSKKTARIISTGKEYHTATVRYTRLNSAKAKASLFSIVR